MANGSVSVAAESKDWDPSHFSRLGSREPGPEQSQNTHPPSPHIQNLLLKSASTAGDLLFKHMGQLEHSIFKPL